jgi:hypothetical protein
MSEPIEIDRSSGDRDTIMAQYHNYWETQRQRNEAGYNWIKNRYTSIGYKSLAEFVRLNKFGVTAGTVGNYIKGNAPMPLWFVPKLCYALKVTPNTLLFYLGYYTPQDTDQTKQD